MTTTQQAPTKHTEQTKRKISESQKARFDRIQNKLQLIENAIHSEKNETFIKNLNELKKRINEDIERLSEASKILDVIKQKRMNENKVKRVTLEELTKVVTNKIINEIQEKRNEEK